MTYIHAHCTHQGNYQCYKSGPLHLAHHMEYHRNAPLLSLVFGSVFRRHRTHCTETTQTMAATRNRWGNAAGCKAVFQHLHHHRVGPRGRGLDCHSGGVESRYRYCMLCCTLSNQSSHPIPRELKMKEE